VPIQKRGSRAQPTSTESPAQGRNEGAGEKLSPAKAPNAESSIFYKSSILIRSTYEELNQCRAFPARQTGISQKIQRLAQETRWEADGAFAATISGRVETASIGGRPHLKKVLRPLKLTAL